MDEYRVVRQRLDMLDYREPFALDALPLVQRLLHDLVQASDACRALKDTNDALEADKAAREAKLEPLRQEVALLTADNNQLHKDLIAASDKAADQAQKTSIVIRTLENEISDLKFLNSQTTARVHQEQRKREEERTKVEELLRKLKNAGTKNGFIPATAGGSKKTASSVDRVFRRISNIDLQTGLEPMQAIDGRHGGAFAVPAPPDPDTVDMLKITESRLKTVQESKADLERRNGDLEGQIELLREQILTREQEITRLGSQLELSKTAPTYNGSTLLSKSQKLRSVSMQDGRTSPRTSPSRSPLADQMATDDRIEQLESQVDFLQDTIQSLEKQLASGEQRGDRKLEEVVKENATLQKEIEYAKAKNEKLVSNLDGMEQQLKSMQQQTQRALGQSANGASFNASRSRSKFRASGSKDDAVVRDLQEDLRAMEGLLATANEQHTVVKLENEALQKEQERIRTRCHELEKELARADNGTPAAEAGAELRRLRHELETANTLRWSLEQDLQSTQAKLATVSQLQTTIETQRNEMSRLTEQLHLAEERISALTSLHDLKEQERAELIARCRRTEEARDVALAQRDALITDMQHFEEETRGLDEKMRSIAQERDRFRTLYQQLNGGDGSEPEKLDGRHFAMLKDKETELATVRAQLATKEAELDKLQQRLVNLNAEPISDAKLQAAEEERDKLKLEHAQLAHDLSIANERLAQLERQLSEQSSELSTRQSTMDQMKAQLIKVEQAREQLGLEQSRTAKELADAQAKLNNIYTAKAELHLQDGEKTSKLAEGKAVIMDLQHSIDRLRADLLASDQARVEQQSIAEAVRQDFQESQRNMQTCRQELAAVTEDLERFERDCARLKALVFEMKQEKQRLEGTQTSLLRELQVKEDKLQASTKTVETLKEAIQTVTAERGQLVEQCAEAQRKIAILAQLAKNRDAEKADIIENYRRLVGDQERAEANLKATAKEAHSLRMQLLVKEKQIGQIKSTLESALTDLKDARAAQTAAEQQCERLTHSVEALERDLKQNQVEKAKALREVMASRDVAMQLDQNRDEMQKQHSKTLAENNRLRTELHDLRTESELLAHELKLKTSDAEKLEASLKQDRTARLRAEKSLREVTLKKSSLETQLVEVDGVKSTSVSSLMSEVRALVKDKSALQAQVLKLETKIGSLDADLERYRAESEQWKSRYRDSQDELHKTEKLIDEIMNTQHIHSAPDTTAITTTTPATTNHRTRAPEPAAAEEPTLDRTQFERRISSELQATQRKLKRYEHRLSQQSSASDLLSRRHLDSFDSTVDSSSLSEGGGTTDEVIATWREQNRAMQHEIAHRGRGSTSQAMRDSNRVLQATLQLQQDLLTSDSSVPVSTTSSAPGVLSSSGTSHRPSLSAVSTTS
ncbi:hypothetical protein RI367_006969 [Sorochytrium milnesiophthora]